ncbi:MAG TPA: DUF92 domain-containing protein [Candidatus Baltobacteraceae bacterium]|nr:DUF92 domain-containing protein [Candidatus Baltobacteraceae bacterium]
MRLTLAPLTNFDIGGIAAALIAFVAYRVHALTGGGALAAFVVGTVTYGSLAAPGTALLLAFFLTSLVLSRIGGQRKRALRDVGKLGPRDGTQVLANGGVAALCAVLALHGDARYAIAFGGALAAATADTWGTEIGTLVRGRPRSILTLRPIATGLSGGVSLAGTFAEAAGALFIAAVALLAGFHSVLAILAGGAGGALADSLLGASVQSLRWCPNCGRACETEPHACGANTTQLRGWQWFGNDAVNFACTLVGAGIAFALAGGPLQTAM